MVPPTRRPKAICRSSCTRCRFRAFRRFRPPRCRKRCLAAALRCFRICCLFFSSERTLPWVGGRWGAVGQTRPWVDVKPSLEASEMQGGQMGIGARSGTHRAHVCASLCIAPGLPGCLHPRLAHQPCFSASISHSCSRLRAGTVLPSSHPPPPPSSTRQNPLSHLPNCKAMQPHTQLPQHSVGRIQVVLVGAADVAPALCPHFLLLLLARLPHKTLLLAVPGKEGARRVGDS